MTEVAVVFPSPSGGVMGKYLTTVHDKYFAGSFDVSTHSYPAT